MSSSELDGRDWQIIDIIKKTPGLSKERIVREMKKDAARMTVLNKLDRLEGERFIVCRKLKPNSQIYQVYINEDDLLMSVINDIDNFKKLYFELINQVRKKIKEEIERDKTEEADLQDSVNFLKKEFRVINHILLIFRHLVSMCILARFFIWSEKIKDKESLENLYQSAFNKLQEMQLGLTKLFPGGPSKEFINEVISSFFELRPEKLSEMVLDFRRFGLDVQLLPVLDSLWKITANSIPSSSFSTPTVKLIGLAKDKQLKHWRKIVNLDSL
jgi:hypothetical protein